MVDEDVLFLENLTNNYRREWDTVSGLIVEDEVASTREFFSDPILKISFIQYLSGIAEERAALYLRRFLFDDNPAVVDAAKKSFDRNSYTRKLYLLIPVLNASSSLAQRYAIEKLSLGGISQAIEPMLALLENASEALQIEILSALELLPDSRVVSFLPPFLDSPNVKLRLKAVMVLSAVYISGKKNVRRKLLECLRDSVPEIRKTALWALEKRPLKRDLKILFSFSKNDPHPEVRQTALEEFVFFPTQAVVQHLVEILDREQDPHVLLKAQSILMDLPAAKLTPILHRLTRSPGGESWATALCIYPKSKQDTKFLSRYLKKSLAQSETEQQRFNIFELMGATQDAELIPLLRSRINSSDPSAYAALHSLLQIERAHPSPQLLESLLAEIHSTALRQILLRHLVTTSDYPVTDRLLASVIESAHDPSLSIRLLAIQALMQIKRENVYRFLFNLLLHEKNREVQKLLEEKIAEYCGEQQDFLPRIFRETAQADEVPFFQKIVKNVSWFPQTWMSLFHEILRRLKYPGNFPLQQFLEEILTTLLLLKQVPLVQIMMAVKKPWLQNQVLWIIARLAARTLDLLDSASISYLEDTFASFNSNGQRAILEILRNSHDPSALPFLCRLIGKKKFNKIKSLTTNIIHHMIWRSDA